MDEDNMTPDEQDEMLDTNGLNSTSEGEGTYPAPAEHPS